MKRLLLASLLAGATLAGAADRAWQDGKLTDVQTQTFSRTNTGLVTGVASTDVNVYDYTITASGGFYVGEERRTVGLFGRKTPLDLDINATLKFAIDKHDLYVLDKDGKEHKLKIIKHGIKE